VKTEQNLNGHHQKDADCIQAEWAKALITPYVSLSRQLELLFIIHCYDWD